MKKREKSKKNLDLAVGGSLVAVGWRRGDWRVASAMGSGLKALAVWRVASASGEHLRSGSDSNHGDFTPVCTTELGAMAAYAQEFSKRGAKLLGLSCDDIASHNEWIKDVEAFSGGHKVTYPIIADPKREIIKQLNMVDPDEKSSNGQQLPSRALHIIGPNNMVKLSFLYPSTTGRNMDEVVRVLDSLQKAAKYKVATPVNWKQNEKVVISPSVNNDEAKKMFPQGYETADLPSKKDYLRFTKVD